MGLLKMVMGGIEVLFWFIRELEAGSYISMCFL